MLTIGRQLAAAGLTLGLATGAMAADMAKSGDIAASVTDATTARALELGNGRTLYVLDSVLVVRGDDDGSLMHNMTGQCYALEEVTNDTGAAEASGFCTYTDADGHKIYEALQLERASGAEPASGSSRITGGSGKYEGIGGELTHTRLLLPSPTDGVYPGSGRLEGSYTMK